MKTVWPRPLLFLPPLRLFLVILHSQILASTRADRGIPHAIPPARLSYHDKECAQPNPTPRCPQLPGVNPAVTASDATSRRAQHSLHYQAVHVEPQRSRNRDDRERSLQPHAHKAGFALWCAPSAAVRTQRCANVWRHGRGCPTSLPDYHGGTHMCPHPDPLNQYAAQYSPHTTLTSAGAESRGSRAAPHLGDRW